MGTVKSVRLNDKAENMFRIIKYYYSKQGRISDTEIFISAIEGQYEMVVSELDEWFVERMSTAINEESQVYLPIFKQICDFLGVVESVDGSSLQEEFWCFLGVNASESHTYSIVNNEKISITRQYEKIWNTVSSGMDESLKESSLEVLNTIFERLYGDEYSCE